MLVVREIMHCKPGKARPLVEKFLGMRKLMEKSGMGSMRVMTDMSAERYWTVVFEMEVPSLDAFEKEMSGMGKKTSKASMKKMEKLMQGYHELVDSGRREIYRLEG